MMKINDSNRSQWVWGVVVGLMTMATPLAAVGETIIVQDGESIQAAVD